MTSWAVLVESKCPRCESLSCTDTGYGFILNVDELEIGFTTFFCRACGLKFDVRDDNLR